MSNSIYTLKFQHIETPIRLKSKTIESTSKILHSNEIFQNKITILFDHLFKYIQTRYFIKLDIIRP